MLHKAVAIVLALQMAVVFSAPTEKVVTTVVGGGNRNMQELLDELTRTRTEPVPDGSIIKKTTTTTTTTTQGAPNILLSEDEQLRQFMKDPNFARELREFLLQFLKMYNAMNRTPGSQITATTEQVDVNSLLKNQPFIDFLGTFFASKQPVGTGPASFVTQYVNQRQTTSGSTTRPVAVDRPSEGPAGINVADSLIDKISTTTTVQNKPATSAFPSRFGGEVTPGTGNVPSITSSESVLNELRRQAADRVSNEVPNRLDTSTTSTTVTNRYPGYETRPTVVITNPSTVISDTNEWSHVQGDHHKLTEEELRQQARNAKYQFATQVSDGISGNFQQRAEIRENGVVYGKYAYDDGFYFRTVYYEADEHGFKIIKQDVLPSRINALTGQASVQTLVNGNLVDYQISEKDIHHLTRSEKPHNTPLIV